MPPEASKPKPRPKSKYGDPFKLSAEQKRYIEKQRFQGMAQFIKQRTGDKRPVDEIAADLSRAELKRDTRK